MTKMAAFKRVLFTGAALVSLASLPAHAQTYDDGSSVPTPPPAGTPSRAPTAAGNWAGSYAGVHFGGTWSTLHGSPSGTTDSMMGGGQLGYNWQANHIVLGVEGDASKYDISQNTPTLRYDQDWQSTLRARAGYAVGRFLPYATAGLGLTDTIAKVPRRDRTRMSSRAWRRVRVSTPR